MRNIIYKENKEDKLRILINKTIFRIPSVFAISMKNQRTSTDVCVRLNQKWHRPT